MGGHDSYNYGHESYNNGHESYKNDHQSYVMKIIIFNKNGNKFYFVIYLNLHILENK